jgi:hypothetical protein
MDKWKVSIIVIWILLILGVVGYLFQYAGVKNYIKAVGIINKLSGTEKTLVKNNFYGDFDMTTPENTYGGILARVDKNGIWILGEEGLKYFSVSGAKYQAMDTCPNELTKYEKNIISNVSNTSDFGEWSTNVKTGDNVVVLSKSKVGKFVGKMDSSVLSFNWWYFLGVDLKQECEK